jgi:hypothetical protein
VIKEKKRGRRGRWKACGLRRDRATSTATICLEAHASASVAGMGNTLVLATMLIRTQKVGKERK